MSAIKKAIDHFWFSTREKDKRFSEAIAKEYTQLKNERDEYRLQRDTWKEQMAWAQWISVAERLPENGQHYLVMWRYKTERKVIAKKRFVFVSFRSYNTWVIEKQFPHRIVTHWMPLPPPPPGLP